MASTRFGLRAALRERGLRFTRSAVARGALISASLALLGACASQENDTLDSCNPRSAGCVAPQGGSASSAAGATNSAGGATNSAGGSSSSGDGSGGSDTSASGSTGTGGTGESSGTSGSTSTAGSTSGGATFGGAAGASSAGTSSAGSANGGTTSGGTANGGSANGGTKGGTGGTASAGTTGVAGTGGATNAACTTAIPARTSWTGTASSFSNVCASDPTYGLCNPPAYAFDADPSSRFSTGTKQIGGEWLQIDLGAGGGTVDQITTSISNGDYGRHLQIRMSNTANDTTAAVLAEQDGVTGLMTFKFAAKTARYILITQTGMDMGTDTAWWSVQDITATCD